MFCVMCVLSSLNKYGKEAKMREIAKLPQAILVLGTNPILASENQTDDKITIAFRCLCLC